MKILQTSTFSRSAKKLHRNQKPILKEAIECIQKDPLIGELKRGDLAGVRVYKFFMSHQLILLAYLHEEEAEQITLISFGSHENFYKDVKKQLKS